MTKWKLVPVEPTPEMVWKAEEDSPPFYHGDPWYGSEPPSEGQCGLFTRLCSNPPAAATVERWRMSKIFLLDKTVRNQFNL